MPTNPPILAADERKAHRALIARRVGLVTLGITTAVLAAAVVRRNPTAALAAASVAAPAVLAVPMLAAGCTPCRDGWMSPSLPGRGTCSHHDGIER